MTEQPTRAAYRPVEPLLFQWKGAGNMKTKVLTLLTAFAIAGASMAPPAAATDGHFLHGVGAINSSMGGVGIAMPRDVLVAFYTNPAGLMAFDATRADFSFEMFKPTRSAQISK